MVRWPLALLSDYYHWQTNSFSSCAQTAWGPLLSRTPFDDFMQNIAKPLGLDLNITVNYGSNDSCTAGGDPNEAASWVDTRTIRSTTESNIGLSATKSIMAIRHATQLSALPISTCLPAIRRCRAR